MNRLLVFFFSWFIYFGAIMGQSGLKLPKKLNKKVSQDYTLQFPRDHGEHPDYAFEWWYITGHLFADESMNDKVGGFQLTVFRISPQTSTGSHTYIVNVAYGLFASGTYKHKMYRFAEGSTLISSQETLNFNAPGIQMQLVGQELVMEIDTYIENKPFKFATKQMLIKNPVKHGKNGFSRKGTCSHCASMYVSFTRMQGDVSLNGKRYFMSSWYDQEFGTDTLSDEQVGWDWFGIQLKDGREYKIFQLRDKDGQKNYSAGALIEKNGEIKTIDPGMIGFEVIDHWKSKKTSNTYPVRWQIEIGGAGKETLDISASHKDQEFVAEDSFWPTYWEGTMEVYDGKGELIGHAYGEFTGYGGVEDRPNF